MADMGVKVEMFYYEEADFAGHWRPRTTDEKPVVVAVNGVNRTKGHDGLGPRVRAVIEVVPYLQHLTLTQKRECFSPDGAFYCMNRGK